MASGSFSNSYGGYTIRTDWSSTTNIEGNYSTVTCNHYLVCSSGWDLYIGTRDNSCTVNGQNKGFSSPAISSGGGTTTHVGTTTYVVEHNSEGKKTTEGSTTFYLKATINGSYVESITASGQMVLDDIPRASTLTGANGTLNTQQTLTITEATSAFTHTLTYSCGTASGTVTDVDGTKIEKSSKLSINWKPPISLASQNTTGTKVTIKFTLTTYNGTTKIGSSTKSYTYTIPSSVKPTCELTVEDSEGYSSYGGYIQGISKIKATIAASSSYGATIKSYSTTANGSTYTKSSFTTGILNTVGTSTVSAKVTDTRGRTATDSVNITVLEYNKPKIDKFAVHRCDANGTENQDGSYVSVTYSYIVASVNNKNRVTVDIQYKKSTDGASGYITTRDINNSDILTLNDRMFIFEADTGSSYDVAIIVYDNFDKTNKSTSVSTAFTFHHYKGPDTEGGGKNLIDHSAMVSGYPTTAGELTNTVGSAGCLRTGLFKVKPSTTYTFSFTASTDHEKWIGVALYSSNDVSSFIERKSASANTFIFTTTAATNYMAIGAHNLAGASNVQLEEGSKVTDYEPYIHPFKASMGLGKMAELEGGLDIGFYTRFNEGIKPIHMLKGADFNDCNTPGNVYVGNYYLTSGDYLNAPDTLDYIFIVIVHKAGSSESVLRQEFIGCSRTTPKHFERYCFSGTWGEWLDMDVLTAKNIYPVGSKHFTNSSTNPSSYLGGTWVQERVLYGGELIAFACVSAVNSSQVSVDGDVSLGFGDSRIGTKTHDITNYVSGIFASGNGAIKVDTQGIVGMVEATVTISGKGQSGIVGLWYLGNNNALPDGVTIAPYDVGSGNSGIITGPTSGVYGGSSHQYFYKVTDGLDTTFYVNPKFNTYGGGFYPSCDGTKSCLLVKAYAKHATTYMWRRTA